LNLHSEVAAVQVSTLVRHALVGALGVFGAIVIIALAFNHHRSPEPPQHVKLNVDLLCNIEFDLDPGQWEQEPHQHKTWRLSGTKDDSRVWLHVFSQRGAERGLPSDCRLPEPRGSESTPNGVLLAYQSMECAGGPPRGWGAPSAQYRLYASLEARFVTLRLVAAGTDRAQVLAQQDALRAIASTLKLGACPDLTRTR
jgi:hypothetical protein